MVTEQVVKELFIKGQVVLARHENRNLLLGRQFFRGQALPDQHPRGCSRHLSAFEHYNIIPNYCFDCYKVLIEPRTVVELFKLMVVFKEIKLPNDNARKCTVENRDRISGAYKGLIYCRGLSEAEAVLKKIKKIIPKEISRKIPISLKRGCSEYAEAHPEYALIKQGSAMMPYKKEWQKYEDLTDKNLMDTPVTPLISTYNKPSYTAKDAGIMLTWIRYAATNGDLSYKKITGSIIQPHPNLKRSTT